jgi:hypothetical protein
MRKSLILPLLLSLTACSSTQQATQPIVEQDCGVERWHVKNILDPDSSSILQLSEFRTLGYLDSLPRTSVGMQTARLPLEKRIVTVTCTVTQMKKEDDGDVHLLLEDSAGNMLIAEVPNPTTCTELARSRWAKLYSAAQDSILSKFGKPTTSFKNVGKTATVSGVLFQDFPHGQKNEAPNSIEIHPVLNIQ